MRVSVEIFSLDLEVGGQPVIALIIFGHEFIPPQGAGKSGVKDLLGASFSWQCAGSTEWLESICICVYVNGSFKEVHNSFQSLLRTLCSGSTLSRLDVYSWFFFTSASLAYTGIGSLLLVQAS